MKYQIELSGKDINLLQTAVNLRIEALLENNEDGFWIKQWQEVLARLNKKTKAKD